MVNFQSLQKIPHSSFSGGAPFWEIQKAIKNVPCIRRNRFWVRMCCVGTAHLPLTWHCFERNLLWRRRIEMWALLSKLVHFCSDTFKDFRKASVSTNPLKEQYTHTHTHTHTKKIVIIYSAKPALLSFMEQKRRCFEECFMLLCSVKWMGIWFTCHAALTFCCTVNTFVCFPWKNKVVKAS